MSRSPTGSARSPTPTALPAAPPSADTGSIEVAQAMRDGAGAPTGATGRTPRTAAALTPTIVVLEASGGVERPLVAGRLLTPHRCFPLGKEVGD